MGFPQAPSKRQPLLFDFRHASASKKSGSLKAPYQNDTLNPFDSSKALFALPSQFWGTPVFKAQSDGYMVKKGELYCPGFIGNTFSDNAWDYVEISYLETLGVSGKTPGICNVSVRRGRKIDRKKSSGTDGETITFTGISNAEIEIAITIWTPEQLDVLTKMWAVLQPAAGKKNPGAWDVSHPQFGVNQVKSAMFVDSVGLENGSEKKTKTFVIKAIEYLPAGKKATVTPKKAQARDNTLQGSKENEQPGKNPKAVGPR
jgi:hypothetical protein